MYTEFSCTFHSFVIDYTCTSLRLWSCCHSMHTLFCTTMCEDLHLCLSNSSLSTKSFPPLVRTDNAFHIHLVWKFQLGRNISCYNKSIFSTERRRYEKNNQILKRYFFPPYNSGTALLPPTPPSKVAVDLWSLGCTPNLFSLSAETGTNCFYLVRVWRPPE